MYFCRRDGDARFTCMDASNIHRQINRQDCGRVLLPERLINYLADKLLHKFCFLATSHSSRPFKPQYFERKYGHILRVYWGMNSYPKEVTNNLIQSYAQVCIDFGIVTEEAMEQIQNQVNF